MLFNKPDYYWSLDQQNLRLSVFLSHVEEGIKAAAQEYKLELHSEDLQWLHDIDGDYQLFVPPDTRFLREKATRLARANPSMQAMTEEALWSAIEEHCLQNKKKRPASFTQLYW
jgi:hypothetical protein